MGDDFSNNLIAADVGNSALKLGLFRMAERPTLVSIEEGPGGEMVESIGFPRTVEGNAASEVGRGEMPRWGEENVCAVPPQLVQFFERLGRGARWWFATSVNRTADALLDRWLRQYRPQDCYILLSHEHFPLPLAVVAAERVGCDRLAAALAAAHLRQREQPAIVVDAGTAITVDAINSEGVFEGGAILPGLGTAAIALEQLTAALPWVDVRSATRAGEVIGTSTESAIRSGIVWGSVGAVDMLVRKMTICLGGSPEIFATGGDARLLLELLDFPARWHPHLVLQGVALAGSLHLARRRDS